MAMHFDRWEKDPFFSAAEEVQESADRMDSTYRTWIHSLKDTSGSYNLEGLSGDLRTALGTAKWQLEEFERAVRNSYKNAADEAKDRHSQFIKVMEEKVSEVEKALKESVVSGGKSLNQWVHLDEGERDEFALFLSGPTVTGEKLDIRVNGDGHMKAMPNSLINKSYASGLHLMEAKDVNLPGHRRTASASADIGSWNISVNEGSLACDSMSGSAQPPLRRVPSYSGFMNTTMQSALQLKLPKTGFRKWRAADRQQEDDISLLRSQEMSTGINGCCERSRDCLNTGDDCNKQLYGWYGAIQRMLQRSQYQMQYSRSMQLTFWSALLLFCIVLFVLRAI